MYETHKLLKGIWFFLYFLKGYIIIESFLINEDNKSHVSF
jgi:hypothetical protein